MTNIVSLKNNKKRENYVKYAEKTGKNSKRNRF